MLALLTALIGAAAVLQPGQAAVVDGVQVVARAEHPAVTGGGQASCDQYSDLIIDKLHGNLDLFGSTSDAYHGNRELLLPAHVCSVLCRNLRPAWCLFASAGLCTGGKRKMKQIAHSDNITSAVEDECFYQTVILELSIDDTQSTIPAGDDCKQHFDAAQWKYDCVYMTDE